MIPDRTKSIFRGPLPRYHCVRNFLTADACASLLEFSITNEAKFKPTTLYNGGYNPQQRLSVSLLDFGRTKTILSERMTALIPQLVVELGITPFVTSEIETELVAHGDGAFFKRHIDTVTGAAAQRDSIRLISAVYYFHSEPRAYSGGALRLYRFGIADGADDFIDIQPEQNMLLAFPSWAVHEVMPIRCPSGHFAASRFAVNCWAHAASKNE